MQALGATRVLYAHSLFLSWFWYYWHGVVAISLYCYKFIYIYIQFWKSVYNATTANALQKYHHLVWKGGTQDKKALHRVT